MVGPAALLTGSPGPCCTCRPTGQLVRSMCKGGLASTRFAAEPVTASWLNAQVVVSRMANERMLAHFISGPLATHAMQPRYSSRFLRARSLVPKQRTGAPYLARFSRDAGFHCSFPLTSRFIRRTESTSVESHISRKTSEIWGTRPLFGNQGPQPGEVIAARA